MSRALNQTSRSAQVHDLVALRSVVDQRIPARAYASPSQSGLAHLVLLDSSAVPSPAQFRDWCRQLATVGFERVRTSALTVRQARQAESAGLFDVQVLALLEALPPYAGVRCRGCTRRLHGRHVAAAARIDRAAFGDRWHLDATMLRDVRSATPSSRARIARSPMSPPGEHAMSGFIICGCAGRVGYVQRLAVHPAAQRHGVGTALLLDGLAWFARRRVERVLVNTEVSNDAALSLYRRHGFADLPERLHVYEGPTEPA